MKTWQEHIEAAEKALEISVETRGSSTTHEADEIDALVNAADTHLQIAMFIKSEGD
jgi:fructose-specific phosphotransferase system component IIB